MKVGDYVRTHGYIDKIININDFREPSMKYALEQPSWNNDVIFIGEEDITKSSPNIIDLIEVGDYVNGIYIEGNKDRYLETLEHDIENSSLGHIEYLKIYPKDIKSIVTKEQFESMEYKVGEQ